MFIIDLYNTNGINNHLSSYVIQRTLTSTVILVKDLVYKPPLQSHYSVGDDNQYLCLRTHVVKL